MHILHVLGAILIEAETPGSPLWRRSLTASYEEVLVASLLSAMPNSIEERFGDSTRAARPRYLRRALDYIRANIERDIPQEELVQAAGASLRSLQAAFAQHFGVGPAAYVRRVKPLAVREALKALAVREALKAADPDRDTVAGIAARWGFYNASSFTVAYQREFGERPSASLGRP